MDAPFSACHARIGKKKMGVAGEFATWCEVQISPRPFIMISEALGAL